MVNVCIDARYKHLRLGGILERTVDLALKQQGVKNGEVTLMVTGDARLAKLNAEFLGETYATDVLSFPSGEKPYLGDIAISLPRARAQAKAGGHKLTEELQLLAVHGVLHLLGYDHPSAAKKKSMWAAQNKILSKLGVRISMQAAEQLYSK
jgi:probable rRNA maturation factor